MILTSALVSTRKRILVPRSVTYRRLPVCCWPAVLVTTSDWPGLFLLYTEGGAFVHRHKIIGDNNICSHRSFPVSLVQVKRNADLIGSFFLGSRQKKFEGVTAL